MKVNQEDIESIQNVIDSQIQISMDEALTRVGASNYYQKRAFVYFGMQWLFANWILTSPVFLLKMPSIQCSDNQLCLAKCKDGEIFGTNENCEKYLCQLDQKTRQQYLDGSSLILAFNQQLICDRTGVADTLKAMPYAGSLVGFFIFSFLSDNYGRKLAIGLSWFCASIGAFILGISVNFSMVGIGLFMCGFGVNPAITIQFSLFNEHTCIPKFKLNLQQNIGVNVFYGVGEILMVVIAYFFQYWRTLALYWFFIPIMITNLGVFLIFESPKFVYNKSKHKAVKILNKIAAVNGKSPIHPNSVMNRETSSNDRVYSIIDLVVFRSLRWKFLCGLNVFFAIQVIYYGINFAMDDLGFSLYVNAFIVAIFETASYIFTDFKISTIPRKPAILYGILFSCILLFAFMFLNPPSDCGTVCTMTIIQVIFAGIIRFVICFAFGVSYTYLSEMFPTPVRSQAMSIISAAGTVGSIICPFIISLAKSLHLNPLLGLGIVGLIGVVSMIPLKETLNKILPDRIEEEQETGQFRFTVPQTEYSGFRDTNQSQINERFQSKAQFEDIQVPEVANQYD